MDSTITDQVCSALAPVFSDVPLEDLVDVLIERSNCLSTVAQRLGLNPHASVTQIMDAFDCIVEPACCSTADLDVEFPQEYIAMTAQMQELESENQKLRAESARLTQLMALKDACVGIVRKPKLR